MRAVIGIIVFVAIANTVVFAQAPTVEWSRCYGGWAADKPYGMVAAQDGGYTMIGYTNSNSDDVTGNHGYSDVWVVHTNNAGVISWQHCYGGSGGDWGECICSTSDGGYVIGGTTASTNGDVTGLHGGTDAWLARIDADGNLIWQRCFGGSDNEEFTSVQPTPDGGFIAAGTTLSSDGDVTNFHTALGQYMPDYWVVKVDATGVMQWQKCFGGSNEDYLTSVKCTPDNGYVLGGYSKSGDGDVTGCHNANDALEYWDFWIVKIDSVGGLQWQRSFGGSSREVCNTVCLAHNGGYMVAGYTDSNDGDVTGNFAPEWSDEWILRLDNNGGVVWKKCYGASTDDWVYDIVPTSDGGYIAAGRTTSSDGICSDNHSYGWLDAWLIKIDSSGNLIWHKCYGGEAGDIALTVVPTTDNGYALFGNGQSYNGDVVGYHGSDDYWLFKLSADTFTYHPQFPPPSNFSIYPNPTAGPINLNFDYPLTQPVHCQVYNTAGWVVYDNVLYPNGSTNINISLPQLATGIYALRLLGPIHATHIFYVL